LKNTKTDQVENKEKLFFGLNDGNELVTDEIGKEMNLSEAAVVPVAVGDGKKKYDPEQNWGKTSDQALKLLASAKTFS
jgi:hypothetical protein